MNDRTTDAEQALRKARTPIVRLTLPRCPACGSLNVKTTRTLESSRQFVSQRKACRDCGKAFVLNFD